MTIVTKSVLAAAILAVMAVSAHAQQRPSRQIEVLPAPGQQAQRPPQAGAQANVVQANAVQAEAAPQTDGPIADAAPAPAPEAAPQIQPKVPAPKFVEPKFIERPVRKASGYAGYGHRAPNCH